MAKYIEANLTSSEEIVLEASVSWWSQWFPLFLGGLMVLAGALSRNVGLIFIGFIPIATAYLRVTSTELALTTKRVMAKTGVISRDTVELRLEKVEGLYVQQSVFGRIFNYGTIVVSGTGGLKTPIPFISDPIYFRNIFNEFLDDPESFYEYEEDDE
ncbi:PH domain-containing protein [Moraxella bovis]|uniref:PH domain-containing protein n=1 Tax=Moraxella bovis TaxID=476 RepID=A0ABY6MAD8_MORBO|nr:PH domain-containing protein [Moraxella bovis]UYZ74497.1 PH domain-containing protein [Moraxella bovis]UYZ79824.1 PH domain-containing protein [Moraxella bovis]UYZ90787.1 PH domain-containing protein [Moraxella bovis]UYZ93463.1 PH domain-containing protein [Moraxella bovis]UYZ94018.1 PH domain-containing protein [Moraxella bovis]